MSTLIWINKGRSGCKGNTWTARDTDGYTLRTKCDKCSLEYTVSQQPRSVR